jgi:hypothetical protein
MAFKTNGKQAYEGSVSDCGELARAVETSCRKDHAMVCNCLMIKVLEKIKSLLDCAVQKRPRGGKLYGFEVASPALPATSSLPQNTLLCRCSTWNIPPGI